MNKYDGEIIEKPSQNNSCIIGIKLAEMIFDKCIGCVEVRHYRLWMLL